MSRSTLLRSVADHLAKQRQRAITGDAHCQYKTPSGTMCAIGGILPPELYHPRMEGIGISVMFGIDANNTLASSISPDWPQSAIDTVKYLGDQMPEIGDVDEKRTILATVQRYHDTSDSSFSYKDALFESGHLSDSQLSDVIYRDLVYLTDKVRATVFGRMEIDV